MYSSVVELWGSIIRAALPALAVLAVGWACVVVGVRLLWTKRRAHVLAFPLFVAGVARQSLLAAQVVSLRVRKDRSRALELRQRVDHLMSVADRRLVEIDRRARESAPEGPGVPGRAVLWGFARVHGHLGLIAGDRAAIAAVRGDKGERPWEATAGDAWKE